MVFDHLCSELERFGIRKEHESYHEDGAGFEALLVEEYEGNHNNNVAILAIMNWTTLKFNRLLLHLETSDRNFGESASI